MPYLNLKGELAKKDITMEELSKLLNIHRNSVANKLNGNSSFSIEEAFAIHEKYFPALSMNYLFSTEETAQKGA